MRDMYNNVTKILVDTTKSNSLLYLPLDKIVAQVSAESVQATGAQVNQSTPTGSVSVGGATGGPTIPAPVVSVPNAASASQAAPVNASTVDKRDGLRSRDRDSR